MLVYFKTWTLFRNLIWILGDIRFCWNLLLLSIWFFSVCSVTLSKLVSLFSLLSFFFPLEWSFYFSASLKSWWHSRYQCALSVFVSLWGFLRRIQVTFGSAYLSEVIRTDISWCHANYFQSPNPTSLLGFLSKYSIAYLRSMVFHKCYKLNIIYHTLRCMLMIFFFLTLPYLIFCIFLSQKCLLIYLSTSSASKWGGHFCSIARLFSGYFYSFV